MMSVFGLAFSFICTVMPFVKSSDVHVEIKPGPTALVSEGSYTNFRCLATVRGDWRSTFFYAESSTTGTFMTGGIVNASNYCQSFSNSTEYNHYCSDIGQYVLHIRNLTAAYNNTRVKCKVQYGDANDNTYLIMWAETRIEISEHYRISYSPHVAYINGNLSVVLMCLANDNDGIVTWRRNFVPILGSSSSYDNCGFINVYLRYQYTCDRFNNRYYLTIPPDEITIAEIDSKWQCERYNSNRTTSPPVTLKILDVPHLLLSTLEECRTSNDIEIKCTLNTTYPGYYENGYWIHSYKGKVIRELKGIEDGKSSVIHIPSCSYQDLGDYTCVWKTDLQGFSFIRGSTKLLITGPPVILSYNVTDVVTDLNIYVMFYSLPAPKYTWWVFNGNSIENGLKYTKTTVISEIPHTMHMVPVFIEGYIAKLIIRNKTIDDEGVYTCNLENRNATTDINIKTGCKYQICNKQSFGKIAGIAVGSIVSSFFVTIIGHVLFRCFMVQRKDTKDKEKRNNTKDTYETLGTRSSSGVYDLDILRPSTVYETVESRG